MAATVRESGANVCIGIGTNIVDVVLVVVVVVATNFTF